MSDPGAVILQQFGDRGLPGPATYIEPHENEERSYRNDY